MKRIAALMISVLMMVLIAVPSFAEKPKELVLADHGRTDYVIVISKSALPAEHTAADTLAEYLEKICSVKPEIVTDDIEPVGKEIVIGKTSRDGEISIDRSEFGEEGVRILTVGDKLFLTGGEKRGAIYSVYTFLEDYLGCRWFTKELTIVPETDRIVIGTIDYTYIPCFRLRQTYWLFSTMYADFCAAHKLHGVMANVSEEYGGNAPEYCVNSVHTMQWIITRDMFDEHPEYFGCDDNGNRSVNRQPCFSNEDVLRLTVDFAKRFCSQYNVIFSISQNDGMSFCQCEKCKSFNEAHGNTDSASLINFVNKVAAAVREEYPDARFETLAYQDSLMPPEGLEIADDVVIRMCPINGCVLHDFDNPNCRENKRFNKALKGWAKLTDNIYMWNYSTDFQYYYALFPNITTLQKRYQYFRDNNVIAVFDNGCGENMVPGEFHELKTYLVLKLLWDPDTDIERHISEFCAAYYGEAGPDVVEFIHKFEKSAQGFKPLAFSTCHMTCQDGGESLENHSSVTEFEIRKLNKIINRAQEHSLTPDQAKRLQGVVLGWRFFKCGTFSGEFNWFSAKNNPEEEAKILCRDMKNYGIRFLAEGGGTPLGEGDPNGTVRPTWWYSSEEKMPSSVKLQAKIYPVVNRILRTLFGFSIK